MWLEGRFSFLDPCLFSLKNARYRDVTDHLQLLLRKSGHHLHTTAEREVVRTIKEKCCYVALNPGKEEKDALGRLEEFRLPDGNVVQV
jgi:centractin